MLRKAACATVLAKDRRMRGWLEKQAPKQMFAWWADAVASAGEGSGEGSSDNTALVKALLLVKAVEAGQPAEAAEAAAAFWAAIEPNAPPAEQRSAIAASGKAAAAPAAGDTILA